jgi:hypothetical protein
LPAAQAQGPEEEAGLLLSLPLLLLLLAFCVAALDAQGNA